MPMTWNGAPFSLTVPDTSPFLWTPRLTLIGARPLARLPEMCTLLAWRTEVCIAVTRAVDVGAACAPLGGLLIGAPPIGELFAGALLPLQPAITAAAQPATLAI